MTGEAVSVCLTFSKVSATSRQHRRRPQQLDLVLERVVEGLHEEPTSGIFRERDLALGDRVVDDL